MRASSLPALKPLAAAARALLTAGLLTTPAWLQASTTLPTGLQVVQGQASVATQGALMTVKNSPGAILNWQSFSIGSAAGVHFQQVNATSKVLNRVVGRDPSALLGSLTSNGQVWLLNPNGVLFGQGARVDVAGLVASTLRLPDSDFLAGRYRFSAAAGDAGTVRNEGALQTTFGGQVVLLGSRVENTGSVVAPGGSVALAAGRSVELVDTGLPHLAVKVELPASADGAGGSEVLNLGRLVSDGGKVDIYAGIVNQQGLVQADTLGTDAQGRVTLQAAQQLNLAEGSSTRAAGGTLRLDAGAEGQATVAGLVDASSAQGRGGDLLLQGRRILLGSTALLDASGATGGGLLRVGGDFQGKNPLVRHADMVTALRGATLRADATGQGDGGLVVVWSDSATRFGGHVSTRGGLLGGHGGLAEVSAKGWLDYRGTADLRASGGREGTLLLDPLNIVIQATAPNLNGDGTTGDDLNSNSIAFVDNPGLTSTITAGQLSTQLNIGSVTLQATNNITVNQAVTASSASNLTLQAGNNIDINAAISLGGSLALSANDNGAGTASGSGRVAVLAPLTSTAGNLAMTNGGGTGVHSFAAALTAGNLNVIGDINLSTTSTWTLTGAGSSLNGNLSGSGGFQKEGAGTLTINSPGLNNYNGNTAINAGTVRVASGTQALGTGFTIVNAGGTLDATNGVTIGSDLTLAGGRLTASSGTGTFTGNIFLSTASSLSAGPGATLVIGGTGNIGGSAGLTIDAGVVRFQGSGNSFGDLLVTGGAELAITDGGLLGFGIVTLDNGTLRSVTSPVTLSNTLEMGPGGGTLATDTAMEFFDGLGGTGRLTHDGSGGGTLTLQSAATHTGGTTINGVFNTTGTGQLPSTGLVTLLPAGVLQLGGSESIGNLTGSGTVNLAAFSLATGQDGGDVAFAGLITGSGSFSKVGSGVVTLSGAHTYTGGTTVSSGTLRLAGATAAAGNSSGGVLVFGTLDVSDGATLANVITSSGGTLANSSGSGRLTGAVVMSDGPMSVGSTGTGLTLAGALSGSVGLNKISSGLVSLTGTNTYAGATNVTAGLLSVGDGGNTGSLGTGTVNIASGSTLQFNRGNAYTVGNTLLGAGNVLQQGAGTTTVSSNNSYTGDTTINAGTLRVQGTSGTLGSSFVTVNNGGTLDLAGGVSLNNTVEVAAGGRVGASNGTNGLTGAVVLPGGTAAFGLAGGTLQVFSTVSGSGALNVAAGNVALYAPNSHTGGTSVSSGANLALDGSSAAVPGGIAVAGTLNPRNGAVLPNTLTLGAGASLGGGGGLPATVSGNVVLGGDANFFVTAGDITISGPISGTGNLTLPFGGSQTLTFSGNNTYIGDTRLSGGNLVVAGGNAIPDNSTVTIASAFTLSLLADETLGGLSGAGAVSQGTHVLRVGANGASTTYTGAISGLGPFEKLGSGTLTLTGPSSVGGTNILGGVLALQGANANLGGGVISIGSAQLDLLGGASVSNSLNANGGTLRGDGGQMLGNLSLTGDLTLLGSASGLLVAGVISGSGNVATGGTGTTTFSSAHTYTGSTTVNAGTLVLASANRLPDAGALVVNGGVFDLGAGSETVAAVQLLAGSIVNGTLTGTGGYDVRSGNVSALLAGTAGLVKSGAGTVTLSAQNSYAGTTVLDGGTLALNNANPLTLSALSLNQGTLTGSGAITVGGALQVLGGSVALTGSAGFTTGGSTTINMAAASGGTLTVARPWVNSGTLSLAGDDFIALDGSAGGFITNATGGVMNLASTAAFAVQNLGGAPAFNNAGTLNYNGAGLATLAAGSFTNLGAVNVNSGGLAVNGGGSDSGSYAVATGAALAFTGGTRTLGAGASATGGGRLEVSAGTVDINTALTPGALLFQTSGGTLHFNHTATQTVSALTLTGGSVGGTGSLVVSGAFNASGTNASLQGTGSLSTQGTGVVNLVTAAGGTLAVSRPWINSGSLTIAGDDGIALNASAGGQFVNDAAGTVTLSGTAATPLGLSAGTGTLFNSGTLVKLSTGTQTLAFTTVQNSGTLDVGGGTLAVPGSFTQTGIVRTNTGATLSVPAGFTNPAGATIAGLGTVDVGSGTLTQQGTLIPGTGVTAGTLSINGNLVMSGGSSLFFNLGGTAPGSSDRLVVSGSATLGGTLQASSLPAYNPVNGDAIPVVLSASSTGVFSNLAQPGGFTTGYRLAAGEAVRLIYSSTPGTLVFTNAAGDLNWSTPANWGGTLPGSTDTALISSGFSVLKATGTDTIASLELNAGNALTLSGGTLTVTGAAVLAGAVSLPGGSLLLGGPVTSTGGFSVSGGTLRLDGAASFTSLAASAGIIGGSGSLTVSNSVSLAGASLGNTFALVDLTQTTGDLLPGALSAATVRLRTLDTGSRLVVDRLVNASGTMDVQAAGSLEVVAGSLTEAGLVAGGNQTLSASSVLLQGSNAGSARRARISAGGNQSLTVTGAAGLTVQGGSVGTGNTAQVLANGTQVIALTGGGSLSLVGGSSGTNNSASLSGQGSAQSVVGSGGTLSVQGGAGGSNNTAFVAAGNTTVATTQQITGFGNVQVRAGTGDGTQAQISSPNSTQTLSLSGTLTVSAGAGGNNNPASLASPNQTITTGGGVILQGGSTTAGTGVFTDARIGGGFGPGNLVMNIGGSLLATGGSNGSGVVIGRVATATAPMGIDITAGGDIRLNPGSQAGSGVRVGSPVGGPLVAGDIRLAAPNGLVYVNSLLGGTPSTEVQVLTAGNVTLQGRTVDVGSVLTGQNLQVQATDRLVLRDLAQLTANATSGDAIILRTGSGGFDNSAGAGVLSVTGTARWLGYAPDPAVVNAGGLVAAFKQYAAPFGTTPAASGNGLLLALAPTITATLQGPVSKVYDGTTAATLNAGNFVLTGAQPSDTVSFTPVATGTYADRNAGTGKTVQASGLGVSVVDTSTGIPVFGYAFSGTASGNVGSISALPLVVSGLSAQNKVYDGSTVAVLAGTPGITPLGGDAVSLAGTAAGVFTNKNVGTAKPVALAGLSLAGADAGNYTLVLPAGLLADITPRPLTVTGLVAVDKVYDTSPTAALSGTPLLNAVAGDAVTLVGTVAGSFANANVGAAKPVTLAGLSVTGADAANYSFTLPTGLVAAITPALLTFNADPLTAAAGTPLPPLTGNVTGFVGGETLAGATTGALSWATPATVTSDPGNYAITGGGLTALNYQFVQAPGNASALTLTPAPTQAAATNASVTATTVSLQTVQVPLAMSTPTEGRVLDVTTLLGSTTSTTSATSTSSTSSTSTSTSTSTSAASSTSTSTASGTSSSAPASAEGGSTPPAAAPEAASTATALAATPAAAGEGGGGAPVFRAINYSLLPRPQVQNLLAAREQYKKQVFAQGLFKLEQDPTLADVRPCKTEAELSTGNCVITEALRQEIQKAITARAVVAGPRKPERRRVRQAALPNIERKLALLIGVNTYRDKRVPALEGAVPDARAVRGVLESRLGYETTVLENPTRESMIRAFNKIALEADANDSVVIYYAGHGVVVPVGGTDTGFWLPSDTNAEDPTSWLSNADIARMVAAVGSRQLMLISDSCYSGSLVGNERVQVANSGNAADLLSRKAAVVMSSGGNEPVADEGRDGHSVFAWHFMRALEGVDNWQIGGSVFERVRSAVSKEFPQTPQYGASRSAGHQGNTDFLFERREFETPAAAAPAAAPRPPAPR